ncbi:4'-phosphopantetheinyl transferase superfamily protein [Streptomyces sp. ALI-76-A]|jgi:4'-phosphopantetheinyl transferase|uniref:4'-phosphopantetheinyl transferase family protein n=1 Tax=Streptomyces sp. ALI-76-A TaxID=3025736 RepID=UPI00256F65C8|nr:4'-phosphopantetheinyl transferase superfamily protein [Streptomyces sp. ALI-76-A]MDL5205405.1 4'-phosphopantetheinyl transferase superfamily protein [Streptomyces sp. ALI-76-A]
MTSLPDDADCISEPVHVSGPDGPWHLVREGMLLRGNAVVYTTWGEWLTTAVTDPSLRSLLGRDWTRYRRLTDPVVRLRFVASRLATKFTAAAALETEAAALDLAYKIGGRPYLRGLDQIDVSLTHTDDLIAVGVSRNGRIGVDAEPAGRKMQFDLMQDHMCTPAERAELQWLPDAERSAGLLRLWTLKEAYTKALGQGLRLGFSEFGFGAGSDGLLAPDGTPAARGEWAFATHQVLGRYLISVACHDAGLDTSHDTAPRTMLDEGFMGAVADLLADPTGR